MAKSPLSSELIDRILANADAADAAEETPAAKLRETSLTPVMRKLVARKQAVAAGEDPRVTEFYDRQSQLSQARLPKEYLARRKERDTAAFFDANPDLDPRIADQTISNAEGKAAGAEATLQKVLQLSLSGDTLRMRAGAQTYAKIRDQLSPEIRKKYNLDELESLGAFKGPSHGTAAKQGLGKVIGTPGIKQALELAGRSQSAIAAGVGEAKRGHFKSAGRFAIKANIADPRQIAAGVTGNEDLRSAINALPWEQDQDAQVNLREVLGYKSRGFKGGPLGSLGGNLAELGFTTITDPLTLVGGGPGSKAKAGFRAMEKEGLNDLVLTIKKGGGWKALDEAQQAAARQAIEKHVAAGLEAGAKDLKQADKIEKSLKQGGQSGIRVAGRTVVPFRKLPGSGVVGRVDSELESFTRRVAPADVRPGDISSRLGGAEVLTNDPERMTMTLKMEGPVVVSRKGVKETVRPGDLKVGHTLLDGNAKVTDVLEDGTVELELKNKFYTTERGWDIEPRANQVVGEQGALTEVRPPDEAFRQGKLLDADLAPGLKGTPKIEALDEEASQNLLRVADLTAPKGTNTVVRAGDQFIFRDAEGKAKGILSIADDKVETLYLDPSVRGQKLSAQLYKAAEEAGFDIPNLGADELTSAGEAARRSYLRSKQPAPEHPLAGRRPRVSVEIELPTGGTVRRRPWRQTRTSGEQGLPTGARIAGVGEVVDSDGLKVTVKPDSPLAVGDDVPKLTGRVSAVNADGTVEIVPSQAMTPHGNLAPIESPVEAVAPRSATAPKGTPAGQAGPGVGTELNPLSDSAAYGIDPNHPAPPLTDPMDVARVTEGAPGVRAPEEAQQALFDRATATAEDLIPGERIPSMQAEVVRKIGKNKIVAKLDDAVHWVRREDGLERVDSSLLEKGDVLQEAGVKIVGFDKDHNPIIRGLMGAERNEIQLSVGGSFQITPSVAERVAGTKGPRTVSSLVVPRAEIKAAERAGRVKANAAQDVYERTTDMATSIANQEENVMKLMKGGWAALRKDMGKDALTTLRRAMDVTDDSATRQVVDELSAAGKIRAAEGIKAFAKVRQLIREAEGYTGHFDQLFELTDEGLPLLLSGQGEELLKHNVLFNRLLNNNRRVGNLSRGFDFSENVGRVELTMEPLYVGGTKVRDAVKISLSGKTVDQINTELSKYLTAADRKLLGLAEDEVAEIFSTDVLAVYARRGRAAFAKAAEADMLAAMESDGLIRVLADTDEAGLRALPATWKRADGMESMLGRVYGDESITREISNFRATVVNDETLQMVSKLSHKINSSYARMLTSPLTKGFAFQGRNFISNSITSAYSAVVDGWAAQLPGAVKAASSIMLDRRKVFKAMEKEGLTFEEAALKYMTGRNRALLLAAREDSILRAGFFSTLNWEGAIREAEKLTASGKRKLLNRINPLSPDNIILSPGQHINQAVEDYSRLVHYIGVLDSTASRAEARASVAKYLFDYNDLTPFEKKYMRGINRFYTFMRKNTALQMRLLAERPALMARLESNISQFYGSDEEPGVVTYPGEERGGTRRAAGFVNKLLGGDSAMGVLNIDTPFESAMQVVDPWFQAAVYAIPGLSDQLPLMERPTSKSIAQGIFETQSAGAPAALLELLYTYRTGSDPRTGRPVKESQVWEKARDTIFPLYKQGTTLKGSNYQDRATWLKLVTGITYYDRSDDESQRSLLYAASRELEELIARLKDQGVDTPTLTELRTAGILPTPGETKSKARTVDLTPEMKKQAAREAIIKKSGSGAR